ncbi:uncharacterized protein LOC116759140 [Phocoena sinus]|uniref:uncharacterized protein LOC116759140 n=1 Tax=Phocoena sinus TaxID=42100 RepID=UPI0013C457A0|nr:uncharacterized protein LOC116759140 [Phocoena sinus]
MAVPTLAGGEVCAKQLFLVAQGVAQGVVQRVNFLGDGAYRPPVTRDLHPPEALLKAGLDLPCKIALLFSLLHTLFLEPSSPVICPCQGLKRIHFSKHAEAAVRRGVRQIPPLQEGISGSSCHLVKKLRTSRSQTLGRWNTGGYASRAVMVHRKRWYLFCLLGCQASKLICNRRVFVCDNWVLLQTSWHATSAVGKSNDLLDDYRKNCQMALK